MMDTKTAVFLTGGCLGLYALLRERPRSNPRKFRHNFEKIDFHMADVKYGGDLQKAIKRAKQGAKKFPGETYVVVKTNAMRGDDGELMYLVFRDKPEMLAKQEAKVKDGMKEYAYWEVVWRGQ